MPPNKRQPTRHPRARALLRWGERNRRIYPWRHSTAPWEILVSEVMLQQTQANRVGPYFERFVARWPTAADLAVAPMADVLREWSGLGYPRRAANLRRAAQMIVDEHDGEVPTDERDLRALPGVGPYTASAVRAFAFNQRAGALDTNYGRILARWVGRPLAMPEARELADEVVPPDDGWAWNHAMMDLGALICVRRRPRCGECPVSRWCEWNSGGDATDAATDPAVGSAMVGKADKPFAGSDREARGLLMKALVDGPVRVDDAAKTMRFGRDEVSRAERLVEDLIAEGLVSCRGDRLHLG